MAVMDELERAMKMSRAPGDAPKQSDAARKETAVHPKDTNLGPPQGHSFLPLQPISAALPAKPVVDCSPSRKRAPRNDGRDAQTRGPQPVTASGQERFRLMLEDTKARPETSVSSGPVNIPAHRQHLASAPYPGQNRNVLPAPGPQLRISGSAVAPLPIVKAETMANGHRFPAPSSGQVRAVDEYSYYAHQPPVTILSRECQLQGFNPKFTVWMTRDGSYQGKVNVNGINVVDRRTWRDAYRAKQEVAAKALHDRVHGVEFSRASSRGSDTDMRSGYASDHQNELYSEQSRREGRRGSGGVDQQLQSLLLANIRRLYDRNGEIPEDMTEDPLASRAFLLGFAVGSRLVDEQPNQRRRSRSPLRGRNDRRGRASSDRYRPRSGDQTAMLPNNRGDLLHREFYNR